MCGRSASTVRREGGPNPIGPPYPYRVATVAGWTDAPPLAREGDDECLTAARAGRAGEAEIEQPGREIPAGRSARSGCQRPSFIAGDSITEDLMRRPWQATGSSRINSTISPLCQKRVRSRLPPGPVAPRESCARQGDMGDPRSARPRTAALPPAPSGPIPPPCSLSFDPSRSCGLWVRSFARRAFRVAASQIGSGDSGGPSPCRAALSSPWRSVWRWAAPWFAACLACLAWRALQG